MKKYQFFKYIYLLPVMVLCGCGVENVKPDDPFYAPVVPTSPPKAQSKNGSLYQDYQGLSLFGNTNSHRVGDIITITLDEQTVSTKSSAVEIDKESDVSLLEGGNATILGRDTVKRGLFGADSFTVPTAASQSRAFAGDASADQSNSLRGNITVTVVEVLPNGNLIVRGEKWMKLNRGDEYIRISGMLRKEDVTLDNRVSSTRLANARISYGGTGELADSQKIGWLGRFFNSVLWPF